MTIILEIAPVFHCSSPFEASARRRTNLPGQTLPEATFLSRHHHNVAVIEGHIIVLRGPVESANFREIVFELLRELEAGVQCGLDVPPIPNTTAMSMRAAQRLIDA